MATEEFLVLKSEIKLTRTGKNYMMLRLRRPRGATVDGECLGKVWSEVLDKCGVPPSGSVLRATTRVNVDYPGEWILDQYAVESDPGDLERFRSPPAVDTDQVLRKVFNRPYVDPSLSQFMGNLRLWLLGESGPWDTMLAPGSGPDVLERAREVPAGERMHHSRRGGLLQHVEEMLDFADRLTAGGLPHFEMLGVDGDRLYAAIFLHDLGKSQEYDPDTGCWAATPEGQLQGHVAWGALLVQALWPPGDLHERDLLIHAILSHHGLKEHGTPVLPKTAEALILNLIDSMSARLDVYRTSFQESRSGQQITWSKMLDATMYVSPEKPAVIGCDQTA